MTGIGRRCRDAVRDALVPVFQGEFVRKGIWLSEPTMYGRAAEIGRSIGYGADVVRKPLSTGVDHHLLVIADVVRRRGAVRKLAEEYRPGDAATIGSLC